MSEETAVETNNDTTIDPKVVESIEQEITKLDEAERAKLIAKFAKEKDESEAKYKQEMEALNKKYGKVSEEKKQLEEKYSNFAEQLSKKLDDMTQKFDKAYDAYQPQRTGFANTSANPFRDKSPKDVIKEIGDPRKWAENDALRERAREEFFEIVNKR